MREHHFQWTVVGAGPAGIAAVGQLLDANISPKHIAWIDPTFTVGDFGTAWRWVVSNTSVESFIKFYNAFDSFAYHQCPEPLMINSMEPRNTCPLIIAAQPLKWITTQLKHKVTSIMGTALKLQQTSQGWLVQLACGKQISAEKVILALGGEPMTLPYANLVSIPLKMAMNPELIKQTIEKDDVIAVFGSYQSARTVQENLVKTNAKKILHFYRSERSFEQHIASLDLTDRVECYPITPTNLLTFIPRCNKAIYAVGFTRRPITIEGLPEDFLYDTQTGKIAPGIYGIGMAFPEVIPHFNGRLAYQVSAIWPFIKYLKKIFPLWAQDSSSLTAGSAPQLDQEMNCVLI